MASAQNNLIVMPGGMLNTPKIKISAAQDRRIQRFCRKSGWTEEETLKRALSNFMHDEAPIWEQNAQRGA